MICPECKMFRQRSCFVIVASGDPEVITEICLFCFFPEEIDHD